MVVHLVRVRVKIRVRVRVRVGARVREVVDRLHRERDLVGVQVAVDGVDRRGEAREDPSVGQEVETERGRAWRGLGLGWRVGIEGQDLGSG